MRLNKKKCEFLSIGETGPVQFSNGHKLHPVDEVKYLGCMLNNKGDGKREVTKRKADSMAMLNRLHISFRDGDSSTKRKLQVYNAVIRAKLMYGLESIMLNQSVLKALDAFQLKGLLTILKVTTAFINRAHTNEYAFSRTRQELDNPDDPALQPLSAFHKSRRILLMAKIITLKDSDPSARVAFNPETLRPHGYGTRRVGHPRLNWVQCTLRDFWEAAKADSTDHQWAGEFELNNDSHHNLLLEHANKFNQQYHWKAVEYEAPCFSERYREEMGQLAAESVLLAA